MEEFKKELKELLNKYDAYIDVEVWSTGEADINIVVDGNTETIIEDSFSPSLTTKDL